MEEKKCTHLGQVDSNIKYVGGGCEECLKMGDYWVHLRQCMICGNVGCCDDSKNKHASKHFHTTEHPIIKTAEKDEDWMWCYVDEVYIGDVD